MWLHLYKWAEGRRAAASICEMKWQRRLVSRVAIDVWPWLKTKCNEVAADVGEKLWQSEPNVTS